MREALAGGHGAVADCSSAMTAEPRCHQRLLPRPHRSLGSLRWSTACQAALPHHRIPSIHNITHHCLIYSARHSLFPIFPHPLLVLRSAL
jgi:hypothetical protein